MFAAGGMAWGEDRVERGVVEDRGRGVSLSLTLSEPVPWRVFYLDAPPRLGVDLQGVTWTGGMTETAARAGPAVLGAGPGDWARLLLPLDTPMLVDTAEMATLGAEATLRIVLSPATETEFARRAGAPEGDAGRAAAADGALRVMIDPGHGGKDPGAEEGPFREADLTLQFAREFQAVLLEAGVSAVGLTREADEFLPLFPRIARTRAFGADVLISLHTDKLPAGSGAVSGATVYVLSSEEMDEASARLVARHERHEPLAGAELSGVGDEVAGVLLDLAWQETAPASEALAEALVQALADRTGDVGPRPVRKANFTVLKAPDIPSVLVELGFLSSERDRANLADPIWRAATQAALRDGLLKWWETRKIRP